MKIEINRNEAKVLHIKNTIGKRRSGELMITPNRPKEFDDDKSYFKYLNDEMNNGRVNIIHHVLHNNDIGGLQTRRVYPFIASW